MIPLTKKHFVLAALAMTFCLSPSPAPAAAPDQTAASLFPDPVLATGKGFEIKRSQLEDAFNSYSSSLAASGGSIPDDERAMVRSNLLQHLIITHILIQKATPEDKAKTKELIEKSFAEARKNAPSEAAFEAQIKATGMSMEQMRARIYEEQVCRRVLEHETTNGITVTDAEAKKFYDDNPDKFKQPEEVRAAHILISTLDPVTQQPLPPDQKKAKEKLALEIKARADKGEDFGKLVKQYSEDPGSKNNGGEYTFPRGKMVPEFEAAAFSMKPGQISDPVETRFGYHIIKTLEKMPAKQETFAEVKDKIKEYLVGRQAEKALPGYLERLKKDYNVALVEPKPAAVK